MRSPPPPRPNPRAPRSKATIAYTFYAAAIWGLVAYSLWGPKPPPASLTLASACAH